MLALDGGPPHRGTMLYAPSAIADLTDPRYDDVVFEIQRGIQAVSGLFAEAAEPMDRHGNRPRRICPLAGHRHRRRKRRGTPRRHESTAAVRPGFHHQGEIKNVITAVAKTTHYYGEHVPPEVKASTTQAKMEDTMNKFKGIFG